MPRLLANLLLLLTIWVASSAHVAAQGEADGAAVESPASETDAGAEAAGEAGAENTPAETEMNPFVAFLSNPINLILISAILFMFIVVRPQQRQMKQLQKDLADLKKNDRVVTASGIHGTVVQSNAGESVVTIRIDENSGARMTINRESIAKIETSESKKT